MTATEAARRAAMLRPVMAFRWAASAPLLIGVMGTVVALLGSWRPSLWYDEAATISATDRSYPQLFGMLHHVDAVHAAYYAVMRAWTAMFGFSEFSVRLPSALAVGVAAGLMVVLGTRLADRRFGVVAGVLLLAVPRTMWAGSEARSYAGTIMLAVAAVLVLLVALDRGRWWWAGYTTLLVVSVVWFLLAVSMLAVHLLIVIVLRRTAIRWFLMAAVIGVVVLIPFAWFAVRQRDQVSWIQPASSHTLVTYARYEFVDGSLVYASVAGVIGVGGLLAAALLGRIGRRAPMVVGLLWLLLPTAAVLAFSWLSTPVYVPRYLAFTLPGFVLVASWATVQLARGRLWLLALLVAVTAASAVPDYLAQRGPYGRVGGTDFSQVADYVGAHAAPGDCVAFALAPTWSPVSERVVKTAKPADFAGLRDVGPRRSAIDGDTLWDLDRPTAAYGSFARSCQVMWVLTDRERNWHGIRSAGGTGLWRFTAYHFANTELHSVLAGSGLHTVTQVEFNNSQVVEMRR